MKTIKYIKFMMLAFVLGMTATSCMDEDWNDPNGDVPPYGNNELKETNVLSIAELKDRYLSNVTKASDTVRIKDDVQIKGWVTGNDIEGNIYSEIALQDETGAILVCINKSGLFGYLPVGQEILIDLKDLYIGYYGNMPQIGTPYTNSRGTATFPSRMNNSLWQTKFKLIGTADASKVQPEEFDVSRLQDADYVKATRGKLMTVKGIEMDVQNDTTKWAPDWDKDNGGGVSRVIKVNGKANSNFVVRSSTYADFAMQAIPKGKINLTGIFTIYATNPDRYGYTWQILLRSGADIEVVNEN